MKYDINLAIASYASSFNNNEKKLEQWCLENNAITYKEEIIAITRAIESAVEAHVYKEEKQFTANELREIIITKIKTMDIGISEEGVSSLLDYTAWICWHEGYLKGDYNRS